MFLLRLSIYCLLSFTFFSGLITAGQDKFTSTTMDNMQNHDTSRLIQLAQDYLQFVHDVGQIGSVRSDDPRISTLFAENLTKIDNRTILFANNREALLPQMRGFEKEFNPTATQLDWKADFDSVIIIPSAETNSVVMNFAWEHINIGKATTMVILQCNANNQIERIIDVWNKI